MLSVASKPDLLHLWTYGHQLVIYVIYACFVLHNFCEDSKETVAEHSVLGSIEGDKDVQPPTQCNNYLTDGNEGEGKRVRRVLTKYLDP